MRPARRRHRSHRYHLQLPPGRQLAHITRPDGRTVDFACDASSRLATISFGRGNITFSYDPATGQLTLSH